MASDARREWLRKALAGRLCELRSERIRSLSSEAFGPEAPFVSQIQAQAAEKGDSLPGASRSLEARADGWTEWDGDCLQALRRLSLNEELIVGSGEPPPSGPFLNLLRACAREPERRFQLLVERYKCPLNIALDSEHEVREHLLERLMVQDRTRMEKGALRGEACDDLLLKLNLVAIYAARATDLRYLDALNYYYELRPERLGADGRAPWLLVSYLGFYAQALSLWLKRKP